jgi:peptidoglycan/xylan/chitin deacetylase (PgdA/CDA1 family)
MPASRIVLWVASIAGIALLVRSLLTGPVPMWVAGSLLLLYLVLTGVGWFFPQLEMYADAVWRGRPGQHRVALTFDDGPHPQTTRKVLRLLAKRGNVATFFVLGSKALAHADVVREIHEAGHTLGLHGFIHDRLYAFKTPRQVVADIQATQQAVEQACGVRPTLFRPPLGHLSPRTAAGARRAGVTIVAWNVMGLDGLGSSDPGRVERRVTTRLRDGALILLHDSAEHDDHEPAGVAALPRILEAIEQRSLRTVSVQDYVAEAQS